MDGVRLEEILRKAELLSGGPLPEDAGALAETAARQAMALCQREDVPEDMELAVASLLLSLLPGGGRDGGEDGDGGPDLYAAGAVKSIQRGDTTITYASDGASAAQSAGEALRAAASAAAAVDWSPWRRPGRLKHD